MMSMCIRGFRGFQKSFMLCLQNAVSRFCVGFMPCGEGCWAQDALAKLPE